MDEENKPVESKEGPKPVKENIIVINKTKIIIAFAAAIIIIGAIIGYRMFFTSNPDGKVEYIANYSAVLGDANATVYVIEFSDYECPYCQAAEGVNQDVISRLKQGDSTWEAPIPNIVKDYVDTGKVKLVFRNFPLHTDSKGAAMAAACAQEQGKFWEYHSTLFENYDALTNIDLKKYAADISLNLNQFNQCLDSSKYQSDVENDMKDGDALGVSGTPTFFVGNDNTGYEKVVGAQSYSDFKQIIDSKISV